LTIRNSNLRWLAFRVRNERVEPACVSFMHTACVWSEKLPFARYSVVKDHSAPASPSRLCAFHSRGPQRPAPFTRSVRDPSELGVSGVPSEPRGLNGLA